LNDGDEMVDENQNVEIVEEDDDLDEEE